MMKHLAAKSAFAVLLFHALASAGAPDPALPKCPPDWKVELVAGHPQLAHPSVVCCAPDGRVFVAQDPVDMGLPSNSASDSILCLHPDGRITLFATNLHAVFGLAYLDGKLYVHHTPKLSVFTDDNSVGKGRLDLFTTNPDPNKGGNGFNDHVPSNIRFAMDGYFYMSTGDKGIYGAVGSDGTKVNLQGGGIMRFRPDGTRLEVYCSGTRNHLDAAINAEDELFTYDNTDDGNGWWTRVTHMVDGGFYGYPYDYRPRRPYTLWMMADYGGGSPTGGLAYNEDALPADFFGNLFMCEWGKRQLVRFRISREGATYKVDSRETFLTAGTEEFRPVGLAVSPDGLSLYITDWNFAGWKRPVIAGRLLKVTYTGKSAAKPKPVWWLPAASGRTFQATTDELVEGLRHPAQSVRLVAQRRLAERRDEAVKPVLNLLRDTNAPAFARLSAIWTIDALVPAVQSRQQSASARGAIFDSLKDSDASVRRQALRWIGARKEGESSLRVGPLLKDDDAAVRFQAATALGRLNGETAAKELIGAMNEPDLFIRFAVFTALNRLANERSNSRSERSIWQLIATQLSSDNTRVRETALFAMRETFDTANVRALADFVHFSEADPAARAAALTVLGDLHRQRPAWAGTWWATQPVNSPPPPKTVDWAGTSLVIAGIRAALKDESPRVRRAAVAAVATVADQDSTPPLRDAFWRESDLDVRQEILRTLGALKDTAAEPLVLRVLSSPQEHAALLPEAIFAAGRIPSEGLAASLVKLLSAGPATTLPAVLEALGQIKSAGAVAPLVAVLRKSEATTRLLVNKSLQQIGGNAVKSAMLGLLSDSEVELRRLALATLGSLKDKQVIPKLLEAYQNPDTRNAAMLALAKVPDLSALHVFLETIDDRNPAVFHAMKSLADQALDQIEKRHQKQPFTSRQLTALQRLYDRNPTARKGILFQGGIKPAGPEAYATFALNHTGNRDQGKTIFNDLNMAACIKCHKLGPQGGEVGPDLVGLGSRYNRAQIIESVLYPSRVILSGYHQTSIVTKDGGDFSGILRQEGVDELSLLDTEGKLHAIRKADIRDRKESSISLMPEGLESSLSLEEFADLVAYLESSREVPRPEK